MIRNALKYFDLRLVLVTLMVSGCTALPGVHTTSTSRREVTDELPKRQLEGLSVKELLEVSGTLAADLSASTVVQEAKHPVVLQIRRIEDRTANELPPAPEIYSAIIREKLLNMGHGLLAFRDDRVENEQGWDIQHQRVVGQVGAAGELRTQLTKVDYWLTGFLYCQDEWSSKHKHILRYYRVQFMLTDPSTGLIAWERHYDVKNAGTR